MTNWEPTPELRWIRGGGTFDTHSVDTLQQKWVRTVTTNVDEEITHVDLSHRDGPIFKKRETEWRDVPTVGGGE